MMKKRSQKRNQYLRKLRQRNLKENSPRPLVPNEQIQFISMSRILKPGIVGNAEVQQFVMTPLEASIHYQSDSALIMRKLKALCPYAPLKDCPPGRYTRLLVNGETMMSDTPMEMDTNKHVLERAHGNVLIGGLGLGMIIVPILQKSEVHKIITIENNRNVIELVGSQMPTSQKLEIIEGDIFNWSPCDSDRFNTIYFDIWQGISPVFLNEIESLKIRYERYLNKSDPNAWMGGWLEEYYLWIRSSLVIKTRISNKYRHINLS